jgi:2-polyprenyl-6-hydroxyphenyl methylase/3-demethylubiquinone-9 3-methyltransferase
VLPVRGSVLAVPLADGCADVVVAGEILEHVEDDVAVLAECARLLRPGGTLVLDALADTRLAGSDQRAPLERLPGGPPPGLHDPALFVDRAGCSPPPTGSASTSGWWACGRRCATRSPGGSAGGRRVRMKPIRSTAVVFAGYGRKR